MDGIHMDIEKRQAVSDIGGKKAWLKFYFVANFQFVPDCVMNTAIQPSVCLEVDTRFDLAPAFHSVDVGAQMFWMLASKYFGSWRPI